MVQPDCCSTCVPSAFHQNGAMWSAVILCPASKIGLCSTCVTKRQHTPASARVSPVVGLCALFTGETGMCPACGKNAAVAALCAIFQKRVRKGSEPVFMLWHIVQKSAFDAGTMRVDFEAGESGGVTAPSAAHIVRQRRSKKAHKIGVCWLSPSKCTKEKSGVVNQNTRQNRGHKARKFPFYGRF